MIFYLRMRPVIILMAYITAALSIGNAFRVGVKMDLVIQILLFRHGYCCLDDLMGKLLATIGTWLVSNFIGPGFGWCRSCYCW